MLNLWPGKLGAASSPTPRCHLTLSDSVHGQPYSPATPGHLASMAPNSLPPTEMGFHAHHGCLVAL